MEYTAPEKKHFTKKALCLTPKRHNIFNNTNLKFSVMKKQTNKNIPFITKEVINNLADVVNETVCGESILHKTFTAADLWNIQRNYKTTPDRRYRYSLN
jgi:hypothetical protein